MSHMKFASVSFRCHIFLIHPHASLWNFASKLALVLLNAIIVAYGKTRILVAKDSGRI